MNKKIKVRVNFTVEIDAETWATEYGIELQDVRSDVKTYIENGVNSHLNTALAEGD